MLNGNSTVELVCASGHKSVHSLDSVRRRKDAWCGKCGVDLTWTPPEADVAGTVVDVETAAEAPPPRVASAR